MASASWVNEPTVEVLKPIVEEWGNNVLRLWAQLCQYLNFPVEDASPPQSSPSTERSLEEIIKDYEDKIAKLTKTVEAISQRQTIHHFEQYELYFLIKNVEEHNWIHLMRILRVSNEEMERCRILSRDRREQKYQMLQVWLKKGQNGVTSLKNELIFALELIDCVNIASMFKSGRSVMSTPP
ncbi:uncharacterized protein LOC143975399 [Lithobates pipiens]